MEFAWEELPFSNEDGPSVMSHFANEGDIYDSKEKVLLISDVVWDDEAGPFLNGVMTAPFDPDEFASLGLWDALDDPVGWALASVPAPGTGAPDRMGLLDPNDAVALVASERGRFFNADNGAFAMIK